MEPGIGRQRSSRPPVCSNRSVKNKSAPHSRARNWTIDIASLAKGYRADKSCKSASSGSVDDDPPKGAGTDRTVAKCMIVDAKSIYGTKTGV
jgi:hypothetical protein